MDDFDDTSDLKARMEAMREKAEADFARPVPTWIWLVSAAIPLLFVIIGVGLVVDAVQFASDARSARGTVIAVDYISSSEGGGTYRPTIRFQRDDGETIVATTEDASSEYDYDEGAVVDILYSYDDPGYIRIDTFFALYGFGLIFAAFGGIFLAGIFFVRRFIDRRPAMLRRRGVGLSGAPPQPDRRPAEPTTDLSKYGHVHKPKPEPTPAVRRNR